MLWGGGNPRTRISWLGSCWDNWPSWGVLWTCALCWRRPLTNKESAITYFTLMANQEAQRHRHLDCAHWMTPLEASDALPVDPLPGVETDGLLLHGLPLHGLLAYWFTGQMAHGLLVYWVTGSRVYWCTGLLVYGFTGLLVYWFTGSLVHWLTGLLVHWFTGSLSLETLPR